jgi:hypothetical protein
MSVVIKQSSLFPNLHGRGLEIDKDFMDMFSRNKNEFSDKYGQAFADIMFNNFLAPLVESMNRKDPQEEYEAIGKLLANKRSLFLAAFV